MEKAVYKDKVWQSAMGTVSKSCGTVHEEYDFCVHCNLSSTVKLKNAADENITFVWKG